MNAVRYLNDSCLHDRCTLSGYPDERLSSRPTQGPPSDTVQVQCTATQVSTRSLTNAVVWAGQHVRRGRCPVPVGDGSGSRSHAVMLGAVVREL